MAMMTTLKSSVIEKHQPVEHIIENYGCMSALAAAVAAGSVDDGGKEEEEHEKLSSTLLS